MEYIHPVHFRMVFLARHLLDRIQEYPMMMSCVIQSRYYVMQQRQKETFKIIKQGLNLFGNGKMVQFQFI